MMNTSLSTPKWPEILVRYRHVNSLGRYGAQQLGAGLFTTDFWDDAVDYCADMEADWMLVESVLELVNPAEARSRCLAIGRDAAADQDRAARAILLLERMPDPDLVTPLEGFVHNSSSEIRYATAVVLETLVRLEIGDQRAIQRLLTGLSGDHVEKVSRRARNGLDQRL
jgi:hypothetical protein